MIENMLQDMEVRFRAYGVSAQPVWHKRRWISMMLGDVDTAALAHQQFKRLPRTDLSDCEACEANSDVGYYFQLGKTGLGLKKASRILDGSLHYAVVPHVTYARALLPLLKEKSPDTAMNHHRSGYPMVKDNPDFGNFVAMHIAFLALTGNDSRALRLLEQHANDFVTTADPFREFEAHRYATLAVDVISRRKKAPDCACLIYRRRWRARATTGLPIWPRSSKSMPLKSPSASTAETAMTISLDS